MCGKEITMKIHEKILNALTDEQKKAIENVSTPEELLSLAKEAGYELTDEQLQSISGGEDSARWDQCNSFCQDCEFYDPYWG